jgi:hypothetical protein
MQDLQERLAGTETLRSQVTDYSAALARAVDWLGERYLLATPIPREPAARPANNHRPARCRSYHSSNLANISTL